MQSQVAQGRQPLVAALLVGTQLSVKTLRQRLGFDALEGVQAVDERVPALVAGAVLVGQIQQHRGQTRIDQQLAGLRVDGGQILDVDQGRRVASQPGDRQSRHLAIGQADIAGTRAPGLNHVAQGQRVVAGAQLDLDAEPVDATTDLDLRHHGVAAGTQLGQDLLTVDFRAVALKGRQVVNQEVQRLVGGQACRQNGTHRA